MRNTSHFVDRVTDIVQTLSGVDRESLDSSATFLQLGFGSLFLLQVCRAIEKEFDVIVTMPQLADQLSTIETVAEHLATACPVAERATPPMLVESTDGPSSQSTPETFAEIQSQLNTLNRKVDRIADAVLKSSARELAGTEWTPDAQSDSIRVTDDQEEIWMASHLGPEASATYHESCLIHIDGAVDQSILAYALQELVNRHDALRVTFASDGTAQTIAPERSQHLDVVALDEHVGSEATDRLISERILEPIDLEQGPLFRSILFTTGRAQAKLLLVVHHAVGDGWSLGVLLDELSILYSEKQAGFPSSLRPAMQYRDYVSWLHRDDMRAKAATDRNYWLELFRDPPAWTELPTDHPRPAVKTFRAEHQRVPLGAELLAEVRQASRQHDCTVFQLILASLMALLFKITGQSDIVVGIPHAGQLSGDLRGFDGSESLVGHCTSLLPIRTRLSGAQSFGDLVGDVKQRLLEAGSHQQCTYSKIAEELKTPRDVSRVPLVSVSLNMVSRLEGSHVGGAGAYRLGDLATHLALPAKAFNFFDLTIDLLQGDQNLSLDTKYNADLYDRSSIARYLSHWRRILEQVVESSRRPLSQLDLLTDEERGLMVEEWNATERDSFRNGVLHALFESRADQGPGRTALSFGTRALTFLKLEQRANRIAHRLREMGARPGRLVGVCLERSPDMVATLLGVLKSGAAYVPLDPSYPADRLAYVLEDAATTILVTDEAASKRLGPVPCQILSLDWDAETLQSHPVTRPEPLAGPEDLAYVIYTSGSTGKPKGVQIEHRSIVNFIQAMAERPGLGPDDVLLAVTTVSFDIAGLELFLPLHVGARIALASRATALDPDALQRALREHGVTVMQATPATWGMLVEAGWTGSPGLKVLCGGEALSKDLAARLLPRCAELWNMYGPTETTVWSTCGRIENPSDVTVGRPIANTQIYILDEGLQPQPGGVPGELMIGGDGLARGYLGKPDLTALKFIASPFRSGQRIYRTGDLAKFRDDGSIQCLGRIDFQVKIRGFRVELGEIESVLASQAGIERAVAAAREDTPGDKRLVAYVRAARGTTIDEAGLRNAVKATLPDYMVPSRIVALDAFPLTANGKIDRRALPKPDDTIPFNGTEGDRPQGDVEVGLEAVLTRLLRVPEVGRHADFFEIGGHSLLAVRYFNKIHRLYGIRLPLGTLFRAGSIAQIAREIENRQRTGNRRARSLVPIQSGGTKAPSFWIHGASGNVLFYRNLSERLGNEYPFYGLQSLGLDGEAEPLLSIEEMAQVYVKEIKSVQASGPYRLGGYCLGGIIAYEMAQQLKRQGDEVALLALLDAYNFSRMEPIRPFRYLTERALSPG